MIFWIIQLRLHVLTCNYKFIYLYCICSQLWFKFIYFLLFLEKSDNDNFLGLNPFWYFIFQIYYILINFGNVILVPKFLNSVYISLCG